MLKRWKVAVILSLAALFAVADGAGSAGAQEPPAYAGAIVQILIRDTSRDTATFVGSGVLVSRSHILTARHLFLDKDGQALVDPLLRPRGIGARLLGSNEAFRLDDLTCEGGGGALQAVGGGARDLCILHIDPAYVDARGQQRFPPVACEAPGPYEILLAFGWIHVVDNPSPNMLRGLRGQVVAERQADRRLQTSHQLAPGMSGGGLFDDRGRLRAIISDGFANGSVSRVVATDDARSLLAGRGIVCDAAPTAMPRGRQDQRFAIVGEERTIDFSNERIRDAHLGAVLRELSQNEGTRVVFFIERTSQQIGSNASPEEMRANDPRAQAIVRAAATAGLSTDRITFLFPITSTRFPRTGPVLYRMITDLP